MDTPSKQEQPPVYEKLIEGQIILDRGEKMRIINDAGKCTGILFFNGEQWIYKVSEKAQKEYPIVKKALAIPKNQNRTGMAQVNTNGDLQIEFWNAAKPMYACIVSHNASFPTTTQKCERDQYDEIGQCVEVTHGQVARMISCVVYPVPKKFVLGEIRENSAGKWIYQDPTTGEEIDIAAHGSILVGRGMKSGEKTDEDGTTYYSVAIPDTEENRWISGQHMFIVGQTKKPTAINITITDEGVQSNVTCRFNGPQDKDGVMIYDLSTNGTLITTKPAKTNTGFTRTTRIIIKDGPKEKTIREGLLEVITKLNIQRAIPE